jgi:O-antigen/teichoic acid export membrane protein
VSVIGSRVVEGGAPLRRVAANAMLAFSGTVAGSLFSLIAFALTARVLGVAAFGWFAVFRTYALLVDKLVNFQSWQAVITYGARFLHARDSTGLRRLIKLCFLLDVTTASAGCLLAAAGLVLWSSLHGWTPDLLAAALIASLAVGLNWIGTPLGVLRLFNRFRPIAIHQTLLGGLQLVVAGAGLLLGFELWQFLAGWVAAGVLADGALFAFAVRQLRREGYHDIAGVPLGGVLDTAPGLWRFLVSTNAGSAVRVTSREVDTLIVASVLGVASAGVYKVAKQFASIIGRIADPVDHAAYPVLARSWVAGRRDEFMSVLRGTTGIVASAAATMWILLIALGRPLLDLTVGPEFAAAFGVMIIYGFAVALGLASAPLHPALVAMGRPQEGLLIIAVASVIYFACLFMLLPLWGLQGAAAAYLGFYAIWIPWMMGSIQRAVRLARGVSTEPA